MVAHFGEAPGLQVAHEECSITSTKSVGNSHFLGDSRTSWLGKICGKDGKVWKIAHIESIITAREC